MKDPYDRPIKSKLARHIDKITTPIFDKSLQEIKPNTMIGLPPIKFYWRPNNYRRQFLFNTETFKRNTTPQIANFGTKFIYKDFYNTTIVVDIPRKKPAKITAIYKPLKRFYYEIKCYNLKEINERINKKVKDIENTLINALNIFIKHFGGNFDLDSGKWVRFEDDIHGEEFIDKLPRDLIITDTYFKKVYQKGIEFKNPAYVKSYISNRAVEEITPEIAEAINELGSKFDLFTERVTPAIESLAANMATHVKIMQGIEQGIKGFNSTVKKLNKRLDQKSLNKWL